MVRELLQKNKALEHEVRALREALGIGNRPFPQSGKLVLMFSSLFSFFSFSFSHMVISMVSKANPLLPKATR